MKAGLQAPDREPKARKVFDHHGVEEWIHCGADPGAVLAAMRASAVEPVRMVCYGLDRSCAGVAGSWLAGPGCRPAVHAWGVKGARLHPLGHDGATVGAWYEVAGARRLHLGGIESRLAAAPPAQAEDVFSTLDEILGGQGFAARDLVRTWFHLDGILGWYDDFNRVRTGFFHRRGMLGGRLPASTGVGVAHLGSGALAVDALALSAPEGCGLGVTQLASSWQGCATAYGSSFSRAMLVESPSLRHLTVSGTAAIDPQGRTLHVGDQAAQIEDTLEGVGSLLEKAGFGWGDVARAVVYTPGGGGACGALRRLAALGLDPALCAVCGADVCRGDLLFELEVEAAG